ncbi:YqeG family HAD IIIA-type phosphatase [Liquorilactobacillus cacaonum]|uniref:HAD superfamily hydrolase n=1 Tax=Liquorilactobacillus cacaonum DSM 21116 TaxID=1423729 RepID=A0A0R2CQZ8_9LACO|nr:YqeG family HAD IIIA-type phosphatase [Liquorilactobacillus cacaonum]KRM90620.1 HAD superfamily hydrolase [Liquorilactobacillus cacaonum DSM 21116]
MLTRFKPTWMISSIFEITPKEITEKGIKVILTDLDNTLIAWNNPDGTPELRNWLELMNAEKIPVIVVSNNNKKRVAKAVEPFGLPFIARAMKPLTKGINEAKKQLNLEDNQIVLVGDQLLTDVAAANAAKIKSIWVKPIIETDAWNTRPNRIVEKFIKKNLQKNKRIKETWGHSLNE